MDRVRKAIKWVWLNKERMVLVIMLIVLIQRVFELFKEPETVVQQRIVRPGEEVPAELRPPPPPPPPRIDTRGAYSQLERRNPFSTRGATSSSSDEVTAESLGLRLRNIQETGGQLRAQIDTESAKRKWYVENETFEAYQLQSIDKDAGTVVVYSTQHNRAFTLERR